MGQKVMQGTLKNTKCPYEDCLHPNSFEDEKDDMLEDGAIFFCDRCQRRFEIVKTEMVMHLWVRPFLGQVDSLGNAPGRRRRPQ